jgi:ubiquinone/menaquinone biosynthesis C-methylase UbiE
MVKMNFGASIGDVSSNERKYASANPLKQLFLNRFLSELHTSIEGLKPGSLLDVGCGEGFIAGELKRRLPRLKYTGVDISAEAIEKAKAKNPECTFISLSADQLPFEDDSFDTTICVETLEHVEDPGSVVREICRVTRSTLIFSVPHEPFFRLGNLAGCSHLSTFGNPPDHLNHWSVRSFKEFLQPFVTIQGVRTPFPWIICTAEPRVSK